MRRVFVVVSCLALCACGVAPHRQSVSIAPSNAETKTCLADLSRENVRFTRIADRVEDNGCSTIGTVNLIDYGVPTSHLGAMRCQLADRFVGWVRDAVQPAAQAWLGTSVARVESFGTYACRPVNGEAGKRLSEHAFGNAVDVAAFVLADGRRITVKDGWNGADQGVRDFLRAVHASACRRFSVVLGPDANAFHQNHLHLDLGAGPYCR